MLFSKFYITVKENFIYNTNSNKIAKINYKSFNRLIEIRSLRINSGWMNFRQEKFKIFKNMPIQLKFLPKPFFKRNRN
jgi:hypothetical protein